MPTLDAEPAILCGNGPAYFPTSSCHCGGKAIWHADRRFDGSVGAFTRGLCEHCDAVRCDAYPGECER